MRGISFSRIILNDSSTFICFLFARVDRCAAMTLCVSTSASSRFFRPWNISKTDNDHIFVARTLPLPTIERNVSGRKTNKKTVKHPPKIVRNQKILRQPRF